MIRNTTNPCRTGQEARLLFSRGLRGCGGRAAFAARFTFFRAVHPAGLRAPGVRVSISVSETSHPGPPAQE